MPQLKIKEDDFHQKKKKPNIKDSGHQLQEGYKLLTQYNSSSKLSQD